MGRSKGNSSLPTSNGKHPDTEVRPRTTRRRFSAAYKRKIVEEAAQCGHGEIGALLRREGCLMSKSMRQNQGVEYRRLHRQTKRQKE